jgi:hypothetical protein
MYFLPLASMLCALPSHSPWFYHLIIFSETSLHGTFSTLLLLPPLPTTYKYFHRHSLLEHTTERLGYVTRTAASLSDSHEPKSRPWDRTTLSSWIPSCPPDKCPDRSSTYATTTPSYVLFPFLSLIILVFVVNVDFSLFGMAEDNGWTTKRSSPQRKLFILFFTAFKPALRSNRPSYLIVTWILLHKGVSRSERESYHTIPSSRGGYNIVTYVTNK